MINGSFEKADNNNFYKKTVADVIAEYGLSVKERFLPCFNRAGIHYPPDKISLLAFKEERKLELWGKENNKWVLVRSYPILGASGGPGPKLAEGDRQVPEGIYGIEKLNSNSKFHLSLKLNYPNDFDRMKASIEGRLNPGSDIFIHGGTSSVGCIAVGDEAAEELFVLAALRGLDNIKVIISPYDGRRDKPLICSAEKIPWLAELYELIDRELLDYK